MTTTNPPRTPTTSSPNASGRSPAPRPRPAPSGPTSGAPGLPPIDPVKIALKYMPLLVAVGVLSGALGVGVFLVWRQVAPTYRSSVIFQAQGVRTEITQTAAGENDKELERFMNTQASSMSSPDIIDAVINDPRTRNDAPDWASQFTQNGNFDLVKARKDLSKRVSANVLSRTKYIELSVDYKTPADAYILAGLVRQAYLKYLNEGKSRSFSNQRAEIGKRVAALSRQEDALKSRRNDLLNANGIDDLQSNTSASQRTIENSQYQLTRVQLSIEDFQSQLQQYRAQLENSAGGIAYPDSLRSEVELDPELRNIRQNITQLQAELGALRQAGLGPNHRSYKATEARIDSWNQELESKRQDLLRTRFDGLIDNLDRQIQALRAQEADLLQTIEEAERRKAEITQIVSQVKDLNNEIQIVTTRKNEAQGQLDNFSLLTQLDDSARITVAGIEKVPDTMYSPKPLIVVPATMVVLLGLTSGLILLREVLDQRVKGPADVTSLNGVKLVGVIPDSSEDPEQHEELALAYHTKGKSVLAESFRQTRSSLARRMNAAGHRSLAIVPAMPGSGATTIATNLATCCAKSDMRVILIDANFRRPKLHKIFNINDGPGLGDVLADQTLDFDSIAQTTDVSNLRVITAGSQELRSSERLSTTAFSDLITYATAHADLVIVDTPPGVVSGDGRSIANRVDSSILIVRAMNETRGLVGRMRNELTDCRGEFLGVLVNGVKSAAGGYLKRNIKATHDYANTNSTKA